MQANVGEADLPCLPRHFAEAVARHYMSLPLGRRAKLAKEIDAQSPINFLHRFIHDVIMYFDTFREDADADGGEDCNEGELHKAVDFVLVHGEPAAWNEDGRPVLCLAMVGFYDKTATTRDVVRGLFVDDVALRISDQTSSYVIKWDVDDKGLEAVWWCNPMSEEAYMDWFANERQRHAAHLVEICYQTLEPYDEGRYCEHFNQRCEHSYKHIPDRQTLHANVDGEIVVFGENLVYSMFGGNEWITFFEQLAAALA